MKARPSRVTERRSEYIAGVHRRYDSFADSLTEAYPVGETTVPKTARDLSRDVNVRLAYLDVGAAAIAAWAPARFTLLLRSAP